MIHYNVKMFNQKGTLLFAFSGTAAHAMAAMDKVKRKTTFEMDHLMDTSWGDLDIKIKRVNDDEQQERRIENR